MVGQCPQDRPVFFRLPLREDAAFSDLHAAFKVRVDSRFFGIGRTWQDDVGAGGACVTMAADIDDERLAEVLGVKFVGAQQEEKIDAALDHA